MSNNTHIRFKRSEDKTALELSNGGVTLQFGEPLLVDAEDTLVLGPNSSNPNTETTVADSIYFRGMNQNQSAVVYSMMEGPTQYVMTGVDGETYPKAKRLESTAITTTGTSDEKYFIACIDSEGTVHHFEFDDVGIYIDENGVMHGAAWNDYAESRDCADDVIPGEIVCEDGHGILKLSSERLQPCAYVVSDTFGCVLGFGNISVAVAGKALVYVDEEVEVGDCLTAGEKGTAVKMTRQEIINYPDRIIGTVIEIPDYSTYNGIKVNGRVWVRIK